MVVIDEAHVYRGVFGSHVANVLRRLRRICARYGTQPRFLLASATIGNPVELAGRLTGLPEIELIDDDGSPHAPRQYAMWDPPLLDEDSGARRSALSEAAEIVADLVEGGARVICFMKARKGVEMISRMVRDHLQDTAPLLADKVMPYRAGYTSEQRRDIEAKLTRGELRAVIATNALELGIDIGALDACVVVTFPGTVASLRQQWGRAGRRSEGSRSTSPATMRWISTSVVTRSSSWIGRSRMRSSIRSASRSMHSTCSVPRSRRRSPRTTCRSSGRDDDGHRGARGERGLVKRPAGFVLREADGYPASKVSLRSATAEQVTIIDGSSGEVMGGVELGRAFSTVHQGAVYFHLGRSYLVRSLDVVNGVAVVDPFDGEWYTQPKTETMTTIDRLLERRDVEGAVLSFGEVSVTETVIGYQRKRYGDHEAIDLIASICRPPPFRRRRSGTSRPTRRCATSPLDALLGALHAAEHTQIAVLPLLAMCDRWDIGGLSTNPASPDERADDLHLRRPSRRHRHHARGLPALRGALPVGAAPALGVPVRARLPELRAVAEVRQPQRAAQQGRRDPAARRRTRDRQRADARGGRAARARGERERPRGPRRLTRTQPPLWRRFCPTHGSAAG